MDIKTTDDLLALSDGDLDDLIRGHTAALTDLATQRDTLLRIKDQRSITREADAMVKAITPDGLAAISAVEPISAPVEIIDPVVERVAMNQVEEPSGDA